MKIAFVLSLLIASRVHANYCTIQFAEGNDDTPENLHQGVDHATVFLYDQSNQPLDTIDVKMKFWKKDTTCEPDDSNDPSGPCTNVEDDDYKVDWIAVAHAVAQLKFEATHELNGPTGPCLGGVISRVHHIPATQK